MLLELFAREASILVLVTHSEALARHFPDRRRLVEGRFQAP